MSASPADINTWSATPVARCAHDVPEPGPCQVPPGSATRLVYASGEVSGRLLPFAGCVTVVTWQGEPEVARREAAGRRLFGFQD
jgi:hypothetical protein